jgi:hypothetical protein
MSFAVVSKPAAIRQLAEAYLAGRRAGRGRAVTLAAARIESALGRDPLAVGESRPGRTRLLPDVPLVVSYTVRPRRQEVLILGVRYAPPLRP